MNKILAVAGITRCGSTMMMRMIHRGGLEVVADNLASYEDSRMLQLPAEWQWLAEARGKAVKLLDLHRFTPPRGLSEGGGRDFVFILMSRSPKEQAKSIAKLLRLTQGVPVNKKQVGGLRESIRLDQWQVASLCSTRGPVLPVRFAEVLSRPLSAAQTIAEFVGEHGFHVDPQRMADAVIPRSPKCFKGLMELQLKENQ